MIIFLNETVDFEMHENYQKFEILILIHFYSQAAWLVNYLQQTEVYRRFLNYKTIVDLKIIKKQLRILFTQISV